MTDARWPLKADALQIAGMITAGEIGALEALELAVARAARLDPQINALCNPAIEPARDTAREIDDALVAARRSPDTLAQLRRTRPFLGVPTLLKDLSTAAIGIPSTMGSRLFGRIDWEVDSELVRRYRRAGFVLFGRTTSPEMGISPSTEARAYGGPTRNPWNTGHSAGGSSGGAAAAVAARIVPIAHATDGAGSIRIPASCCGLVGLKPTRGLIPAGPLTGEGWGGLATEHVVSLSVRDSAAALDASAGPDTGAPYAAPAYAGSRALVEAIADGASMPALRIAMLTTTLDGDAVHPDVAAAVEQAARLLAAQGHRIEAAAPKVSTDEIVRPLIDVVACGTAMVIEAFLARRGRPLQPDELEPTTLGAYEYARAMTGPQYLASLSALHRLNRRVGQFFDDDASNPGYDAMLLPVLAEPASTLGRWAMSNPDFIDYRLGPTGIVRYSPFTPLANMTGQPAISVPLAMSADGLPIGVQILGRFGADALVLQIAAQLERAQPWADRIAPLATSA
jgi:amidase